MSYLLEHTPVFSTSVRNVAEYLIDSAISDIDNPSVDTHTAVHEVRKRCKEMRGLLRLLRGPLQESGIYRRENQWFRDASRELSYLRDAEALIETYDMIVDRYDSEIDRRSFSLIRRRLTLRKKELSESTGIDDKLSRFRQQMVEARGRLDDWVTSAESFDDLAYGLMKSYRRGIKAMGAAYDEPSGEKFHEWRKRAKYHRYHCELLLNIWPVVLSARQSEVDRLSDDLGKEHDCTVFAEVLQTEKDRFGEGDEVGVAVALSLRVREELRDQSLPLGMRLYCETPEEIAKRFSIWFEVWREEGA